MILAIISVVLSIALIAGIYATAKSRSGGIGVLLLTGASAALLFMGGMAIMLILHTLFFHVVGSFLLAIVCIALRLGPKSMVVSSLLAMAASYGYFLSESIEQLEELHQLRAEHPMQSIEGRLNYEAIGSQPSVDALSLSSGVALRLKDFEMHARNFRTDNLQRLHNGTVDDFALMQGFGVTRMEMLPIRNVELTPSGPVSLPLEADADSSSPEPTSPTHGGAIPKQAPHPMEMHLLSMHKTGVGDFLEPNRFGYVQDRKHVAGFEAHHFGKIPALRDYANRDDWHVVKLQLVSLLKHETPVAYVSANLPRMEELRDAPTRPLDEFERSALERLRVDEDLVIEDAPSSIRMVGSLRAAKQCLECHQVRRGDLLGALSYELRPAKRARPPKRPPVPET